jgi:capsular exopolysaccharide synthesis family protein
VTNDSNNPMTNSETGNQSLAQPSSVQRADLHLRPESRIFGQGESDAIGMEQYRLLQGRLLYLQSRMPLKRLLITSAGRGEGKTHVCANLGMTMARETDRKVLLLDADLRKPDLHRVYGIPNDYGITDVLNNGHDMWRAIRKVAGMNLYVMTAGSGISQPLTMSNILTLKMLLDQMNAAFDWVIIDSPPVLVAADTPLLAKLAEGILFVVGASGTPRDLIIKAKDMLETVPVVGAVLNRVNPITARYTTEYGGPYGESKQGKLSAGSGKAPKQPAKILS